MTQTWILMMIGTKKEMNETNSVLGNLWYKIRHIINHSKVLLYLFNTWVAKYFNFILKNMYLLNTK